MAKAYVGEVLNPGSTYNLQVQFEVEGIFSIKFTPIGANLCLLEEVEEGFISELIREGSTWWKQWFKVIKPWREIDVNLEKVMWIYLYGVSCHAWYSDLFVCVANSLGSFVCLDENTTIKTCMDIARIMIRVSASFTLKDEYLEDIDGKEFRLVIREDSYGPMRNVSSKKEMCNISSINSNSEDS